MQFAVAFAIHYGGMCAAKVSAICPNPSLVFIIIMFCFEVTHLDSPCTVHILANLLNLVKLNRTSINAQCTLGSPYALPKVTSLFVLHGSVGSRLGMAKDIRRFGARGPAMGMLRPGKGCPEHPVEGLTTLRGGGGHIHAGT